MKKFHVFVIIILFLGAISIAHTRFTGNVLAEQIEQKENSESKEDVENKEEAEAPEPTEEPEPTETPEQEEENEKEVEQIHKEVQKEIQNNNVEKVEVYPGSKKQSEGTLKVEKVNGNSTEKAVPSSKAPLINVDNSQAGVVSISVSKNGTVTIVNNGVSVQTNYPVVIDPQSKTVAIKTPNGVTNIASLPSQALNNVLPTDKPTTIESAVLGEQDGKPYYDIKGVQQRKFLSFVPVSANVETKIDAQNGSTISVDKPWYLDILGFLYSI